MYVPETCVPGIVLRPSGLSSERESFKDDSPHFISVYVFCSEHVFSERENSKPIKLQDFGEICSLAQKILLRARKKMSL